MSSFAETLTAAERKRGRLYAYFACYFGCVSEVMLDSSAIIIIYISMLGGNKMEVMLSTSFSGMFNMLLLIPSAFIISRIGLRKALSIACTTGCLGFLIMAAAPFCKNFQLLTVMLGCLIFCAQRSLYTATWYPMLDTFLRPQDRGKFFGTMRYTYMIFTGVLFYIVGKIMGQTPPLWLMQAVVAFGGVMMLGRMYCMLHFPENPQEKRIKLNFKQALSISIANGPLVSYSIYVCMISLAYTSLVPLTLLYMKEYVKLDPGTVQIFSTVGIAGSIIGFFCYGFLQKLLKIKRLELITHAIYVITALFLAFYTKDQKFFIAAAGIVYFVISFANSMFLCNNSSELLALARPGNKTMAMAFMQTYQNIGVTIGRTGTALIMGANLLAPSWQLKTLTISSYQTLFLFYGVIAATLLLLIPSLPAIVPRHHDYYEP